MTSQTATSYFYLEGEASAVPAGRAGSESITVEFQGWLGDDLLDLVDRWIVSGRLADALRSSELTGYELAPVTVTKNDQWALMQHEFELPERWERLVPTGKRRDGDDFARERRSGLMVSARALDLVRSFRLNEAEVTEVTTPIWATDEEEDAAEQARLATQRADLDERRKQDDIDRAVRDQAKRDADAARDADIAQALAHHRARHPEGFVFRGAIDVVLAALGSPVEDDTVKALFALAVEPLEHEVTLQTEKETRETWSSRTEGFAAQFKNHTLDVVVVYPAWQGPLTESLVDGVTLGELSAVELATALGEPERSTFGARSYFEYDLDKAVLHFGMLATRVDRIMVMRKKRRRG